MSETYTIVDDPFVIHETRHGAAEGLLTGLRLAVKDLFDVEGMPTACGVVDWPKADQPAARTASAAQALLDAGAPKAQEIQQHIKIDLERKVR